MALGFGLTVLTGWIASLWPTDSESIGLERDTGSQQVWEVWRAASPTNLQIVYGHLQISGRSLSIPEADFAARAIDRSTIPRRLGPRSLEDLTVWAMFTEAGFPFRAFTGSVRWKTQVANVVTFETRHALRISSKPGEDPRIVPWMPVWPAFLANLAIWSVVGHFGLRGCTSVRSSFRRRRGLCETCGYSRRGLDSDSPCPECGTTTVDTAKQKARASLHGPST